MPKHFVKIDRGLSLYVIIRGHRVQGSKGKSGDKENCKVEILVAAPEAEPVQGR